MSGTVAVEFLGGPRDGLVETFQADAEGRPPMEHRAPLLTHMDPMSQEVVPIHELVFDAVLRIGPGGSKQWGYRLRPPART